MATAERPNHLDRIVVDPDIMLGKPTVRGPGIPVELVLEQLSYDLDLGELFAAYPRLTCEDVQEPTVENLGTSSYSRTSR